MNALVDTLKVMLYIIGWLAVGMLTAYTKWRWEGEEKILEEIAWGLVRHPDALDYMATRREKTAYLVSEMYKNMSVAYLEMEWFISYTLAGPLVAFLFLLELFFGLFEKD
jgi:hypothetical protein